MAFKERRGNLAVLVWTNSMWHGGYCHLKSSWRAGVAYSSVSVVDSLLRPTALQPTKSNILAQFRRLWTPFRCHHHHPRNWAETLDCAGGIPFCPSTLTTREIGSLSSISGVVVSLLPPPPPPPTQSTISTQFRGCGTPFCPLHPHRRNRALCLDFEDGGLPLAALTNTKPRNLVWDGYYAPFSASPIYFIFYHHAVDSWTVISTGPNVT